MKSSDETYDVAYESGYAAGKQKGMESQWIEVAALQLLRELGVSPSSAELIEAYRRSRDALNQWIPETTPCE